MFLFIYRQYSLSLIKFNLVRVWWVIKNIELRNLGININSGELVSIIGTNGSGKTVILRMLCGRFKNDNIFIDDKSINEYGIEYKRNSIACVFDDNIYNTDTPKKELEYYLNKLNIDDYTKKTRIKDFINYFKLNNILDEDFSFMSIENRIYIKILSLLIILPNLFCIDDLLTYLNKDKKIRILNYIKEKNITLLSVTSNMEELKLFDKILVVNKGKCVAFDKTEVILSNEDMFKELGLSLPFIYDINNMLKSYELINSNHIIEKELVDLLWK